MIVAGSAVLLEHVARHVDLPWSRKPACNTLCPRLCSPGPSTSSSDDGRLDLSHVIVLGRKNRSSRDVGWLHFP